MMGFAHTFQICVGLLELPLSLGRLLVYPIVEGSDFPAVILWLDELRDAAYILAERSMAGKTG